MSGYQSAHHTTQCSLRVRNRSILSSSSSFVSSPFSLLANCCVCLFSFSAPWSTYSFFVVPWCHTIRLLLALACLPLLIARSSMHDLPIAHTAHTGACASHWRSPLNCRCSASAQTIARWGLCFFSDSLLILLIALCLWKDIQRDRDAFQVRYAHRLLTYLHTDRYLWEWRTEGCAHPPAMARSKSWDLSAFCVSLFTMHTKTVL